MTEPKIPNLLPRDHVRVSPLVAPTPEVWEKLALLRKEIPNKIAEDLCSVQPMDGITYEDLRAAMDWLTNSRLSRGVHPLTEEPLSANTRSE